ncbi:type II toxin-antitoxin system RelE/ParE family toxin [Hyalangium rubrum]|uniref:Type II toxin-antitoxin system RelE/ParE family toxin n=1 Tax=Hyalangium rubrum TaxID=3103134 RepID=A0ABU5GVS2_9BACT|nr:type II toxin-antitoxin system RelE/ParE family toxin [Hyalangium sp. s54d21]MDY7225274.1 type II toxin-antitoxin system RelE/ParE family toxin [Hyalangium sp. s54d21]
MSPERTFEVEWTQVALTDLEELLDFIAQDNPAAAEAALDRLSQAAQRLEQSPKRGRVVPELSRFELRLYRELIVRPWRIIYRVGQRRVFVLAVLDGRRDLEQVLLARLLRRE